MILIQMLALVFSRRTIRLGWFWLCLEFLCLLGTSGHMCYPHCTCEGESMNCHWPDKVSMNIKNGTETIFIHDMTNITCNQMTSTQPIDIHFVGSNIDFIPSCMLGNVTIVNLLFTESKIRVIRCLEFLGKSIESLIFHKSEISSIQPYAFSGSKIKNLLITESIITQIEKNAFYQSALKTVVFVEDAIHYMSSGIFSSNVNNILTNFILYRCDIFYMGCQRNFPTAFTLSKNKMTCDAQLHWLLQLLQGTSKLSDNRCLRPERMRGRTLADLDMNDICWPPEVCNACPSVEVEPDEIKCLHIASNSKRRLLKKSLKSERKPPSPLRKKIRGLKNKVKHAIYNRSKSGRRAQKNNQSSTVVPSISLSAPDITERKDLYQNFDFNSVLNHTNLKGKNSELHVGGKINIGVKTRSSAANLTSDSINDIQGPEKDNSTMLTPTNNPQKKDKTETKIKSLKIRDIKTFPDFSKNYPTQQVFQLNHNSMMPPEEKATTFVSNETKNVFVPNEKESPPKIWKESYLKDYLSPPAREKIQQSQNISNGNKTEDDISEKVWRTIGKGSQEEKDLSKDLVIQTMLKKVHSIMLTDTIKNEKEQRGVFVEQINWAQKVMPMKKVNGLRDKTKLKRGNLGLFQQLLNYPQAQENLPDQKTKETSTEVITKGYQSVVSVKEKTVTT